jgi:hypothetical protein
MKSFALFAVFLAQPAMAGSIIQGVGQTCSWQGAARCGSASELASCTGSDIVYADNQLHLTSLTLTAPGAHEDAVTIAHPRATIQEYQLALGQYGASILDGSFKLNPSDPNQSALLNAIQDILSVKNQIKAANLSGPILKIGKFSFVPSTQKAALYSDCNETQVAGTSSSDDDEPISPLLRNANNTPTSSENPQASNNSGAARAVPASGAGTGESINGNSGSGS